MSRVTFDLATVMFLVWVVILLPLLGWFGYRHLAREKPLQSFSRREFWAIIITVLIALLGWYTADTNKIALAFETSIADFIVGFFFAGVFLVAGRKSLQNAEAERIQHLRLLYFPATTGEWLVSCLSGLNAGISEEIIYRGVLFALAERITSSTLAAIAICVVLFALSHMPQGREGMIGVAYLGMAFHVLFLISGTLVTPIVAHATYDVVLFTSLFRSERRRRNCHSAVEIENETPEQNQPHSEVEAPLIQG